MKLSDRRFAHRFRVAIPLYIRPWKSKTPEQRVDSVNLSERGVYFETDAPPREGAMLQLRLEMPTEVTGQPPDEWRCAGKVVRIHAPQTPGAPRGVSVRFDYYEIAGSAASQLVSAFSHDS